MMTTELLIALISAIATLVITLITGYFAHRWQMTREIKINDRQLRQRAIGSLMGQKLKISQLYYSRFEAAIFSQFHDAAWRLAGKPSDALDFSETVRWMGKSEELALEIAHSSEKLYETLGLLSSVSNHDTEFKSLMTAVYKHKVPTLKHRPYDLVTVEELEAWKESKRQELLSVIDTEISKPLDELIEYLLSKQHNDR